MSHTYMSDGFQYSTSPSVGVEPQQPELKKTKAQTKNDKREEKVGSEKVESSSSNGRRKQIFGAPWGLGWGKETGGERLLRMRRSDA